MKLFALEAEEMKPGETGLDLGLSPYPLEGSFLIGGSEYALLEYDECGKDKVRSWLGCLSPCCCC